MPARTGSRCRIFRPCFCESPWRGLATPGHIQPAPTLSAASVPWWACRDIRRASASCSICMPHVYLTGSATDAADAAGVPAAILASSRPEGRGSRARLNTVWGQQQDGKHSVASAEWQGFLQQEAHEAQKDCGFFSQNPGPPWGRPCCPGRQVTSTCTRRDTGKIALGVA